MGAQRTEMLEALFGLRAIRGGHVYIKGTEIKIDTPREAMKHGMALLTEERRATGIFPMLNVMENTVMAKLRDYVKRPFFALDEHRRVKDTMDSIQQLRVKTPSYRTLIKDLSGGNQQKVLLARWLLIEPEILILDEPTRGIDVGAKYEIYTIIADLAKRGKSIIMISSKCRNYWVCPTESWLCARGAFPAFLPGQDTTQVDVMRLATQFST